MQNNSRSCRSRWMWTPNRRDALRRGRATASARLIRSPAFLIAGLLVGYFSIQIRVRLDHTHDTEVIADALTGSITQSPGERRVSQQFLSKLREGDAISHRDDISGFAMHDEFAIGRNI